MLLEKTEKMEGVGRLFHQFHEPHVEYAQLWADDTFLHWDWWIYR
jgi:hypothetical protein